MDTQQARSYMRDVAVEGLGLVRLWAVEVPLTHDGKLRIRQLASDARAALPDAGFPGEAAWRSLQRASIGIDTQLDGSDALFWEDVAADLQTAIDTLEALVSPGSQRENDVHIVG